MGPGTPQAVIESRRGSERNDQSRQPSIRKYLPEELQVAITVAYTFGWRKREVLDVKRHQYNAQDGTLRLDPGTTKNREGRVVQLTSELRAMFDAQVARVREPERRPSG